MPDRILRPTRHAERTTPDRAALNALLDEQMVAHVGLQMPDGPLVVPCAYVRDADRLLLHGSTGSRWMRAIADGAPICATVTSLDALKVARSGFESGMRYRSACVFGSCATTSGEDAAEALTLLTDKLIPGRVAEIRPGLAKEWAATLLVALPIQEWSYKSSDGFADEPADDVASDAWAGVVPLVRRWGAPIPAPDLRDGIPVPASIRRLTE